MIVFLASLAWAADTPGLYLAETLAVTGWPTGLLSNTVAQVRTPMLRSESPLFQTTYAGVGARLGSSPAHIELGPRLSIKPLEIFDLHLEATHTSYYLESFGLLPYVDAGEEKAAIRRIRVNNGEAFTGEAWTFLANPTGYLAAGPMVALSSWTFSYINMKRPPSVSEPYVFEVYRGLVIGWNDLAVEHFSAVMLEPMSGKDEALLRLGAVARGKWATVSPDRSLQVGAIGMWKPGTKVAVPTFVALVTPYVDDTDFLKGPPWFALVASWDGDIAFSGNDTLQ